MGQLTDLERSGVLTRRHRLNRQLLGVVGLRGAGGGDRTRTTLGESRDFKDDKRIEKRPEVRGFRPLSSYITWLECVADRSVPFGVATATVTGTHLLGAPTDRVGSLTAVDRECGRGARSQYRRPHMDRRDRTTNRELLSGLGQACASSCDTLQPRSRSRRRLLSPHQRLDSFPQSGARRR